MGFLVLLALLAFGAGSSSSSSSLPAGVHQGIYWRLWRHPTPHELSRRWQLQLWWDVGSGCEWVTFGQNDRRPTDEELAIAVRETIEREWLENMGGAMVSASCPPP